MKKATIFVLFVALSSAPIVSAAEQENVETKDPNAPTYQSPILSLLFLPVNLLIKMASVMGPPNADKSNPPQSSPHGPDK